MMTAKTPASAIAGVVDIAVSLNGRTGLLPGGFRYEPLAPNSALVIRSMTAQGRRVRQPSSFADYGETIQITLVIDDAESAAAQRTYQWRACGGNFVGTGLLRRLDRAASRHVASTCTIEVTVPDGPHLLNRSIVVRVHNSVDEVGNPVVEFLDEFAQLDHSSRHDCPQLLELVPRKAAELSDVTDDRATRNINSCGTADT